LISPELPVIFGKQPGNNHWCRVINNRITLGLDIFGSAFFMLTLFEEYVKSDRDKHDRFPSAASLAYQEGFLERPIVNEYLEILWACMARLWPSLKRKERKFQIRVSHDVDAPFAVALQSPVRLLRSVGGDIIKRHDLLLALRRLRLWTKVKMGDDTADWYNTFDWIMTQSEQVGLQSAFYFITDHTGGKIDGDYSIDHPRIRRLMKHIHKRGHEIGLHLSYNTYLDSLQTHKEFERLRSACEQEEIHQEIWGGRQHLLRYQTPATFQNWNDAGMDYDTSLGFADHVGFRCGVCYEYPIFNVKKRKPLMVRERPLIVVEVTIMAKRYMGLGASEEAIAKMLEQKRNCQQFSGEFTFLWHNSNLTTPEERRIFQTVLNS